jgi:hypothetical protein
MPERHILCTFSVMEKRVIGIILTVLGIAGLIMAAVYFVQGGNGGRFVRAIVTYAILGIIFFVAGIGLIRTTRDRPS